MHSATLDDVSFITQFIRGLKLEIRDVVQCQMPPTMIKATLLAKKPTAIASIGEKQVQVLQDSLSVRE